MVFNQIEIVVMKNLLSLILIICILSSCAHDKYMEIEGETVFVECYGWADSWVRDGRVHYETNAGNVVLSIIFVETLGIVPVILTGWHLFEPVKVKDEFINPPTGATE